MKNATAKMVAEAAARALANEVDIRPWSIDRIVYDLQNYDAAFENVDETSMIAAVAEWKASL